MLRLPVTLTRQALLVVLVFNSDDAYLLAIIRKD